MVTTQEDRDPVIETREQRALRYARLAIAGHEAAAIRRIVLYTVLIFAVGAGAWFAPALLIALVATSLLVATDQLL